MASTKINNVKVILQKNKVASGSVLFFHGSGDTGKGALDWIKFLLGNNFSFPHIRIVFPTAPLRHYTPLNGELSNVWFDRLSISPDVPEHRETIESIGDEVKKLIESEIENGIPQNRIVVGGFSMGGALALHTAYRFYPKVAGVFTLSSFLNYNSAIYNLLKTNKDSSRPPLIMFHGDRDDLVNIKWGQETFDNLKSMGINGEFHIVKNALHELKKGELEKLMEWILKILPPLETDVSHN